MTEKTAEPSTITQVYEIYISATPERIWAAITDPEWNKRYGYRGPSVYDLKPGGKYSAHAPPEMRAMGMPDVVIDGEVLEADPPRKLVQTYRFLFSEEMKGEGFTRLTWEIAETRSNFSRLTVTHELTGAPIMAGMVASKFSELGAGGWSWVLSDLKSLLETGKPLGA
jgi:uncharacterized protein YndB with AHSA1/START domain